MLGARRRRHYADYDGRHGQSHACPRDSRRRPQYAGRAHHEPQRRRQDRLHRSGGPRGRGRDAASRATRRGVNGN
ncbi:MAG TPA: hypothetical protein VH575_16705 [Gemmataceae bacterium]